MLLLPRSVQSIHHDPDGEGGPGELWTPCHPPEARPGLPLAGNKAGNSGFPGNNSPPYPIVAHFSGCSYIISFLRLPKESLIVPGQTLLAVLCPRANPLNPGTPA